MEKNCNKVRYANLADMIAGRMEEEALRALKSICDGLSKNELYVLILFMLIELVELIELIEFKGSYRVVHWRAIAGIFLSYPTIYNITSMY